MKKIFNISLFYKIISLILLIGLVTLSIDYWSAIQKEKRIETPSTVNTKLSSSYNYPVVSKKLVYTLQKPTKIIKLKNNKVLFDFGSVNFGTLKINLKQSAEFSITMLEKYPDNFTEMGKRSFGRHTLDNIKIEKPYIVSLPERNLPNLVDLPLNIRGG